MATRTVVCPECAAPLPYGRLACPSCGALVASVAAVGPRTAALISAELVEEPFLLPDDTARQNGDLAAANEAGPAAEALQTTADEWTGVVPQDDLPIESLAAAPPSRDAGHAEAPIDGAVPVAAVPEWEPPEPAATSDRPAAALPSWPEPAAFPPILRDWRAGASFDDDTPPAAQSAGGEAAAPPSFDEPAASGAASTEPTGAVGTAPASTQPHVPAGAYMPPSAVFGDPAADDAAAGSAGAGPSRKPAKQPRAGDAPLLADLPFDPPDDLPGWLVASGAAVGGIGFFLPWAHRVIGSSGEGYLSSWGFGALMNVPIFVAVLVTLGLAVLPNRVAAWLRAGVLPLVVGGVLLGTAWPYIMFGPLNGSFGSLLEAFAGLLLIVGGILALRAARHAGSPPTV